MSKTEDREYTPIYNRKLMRNIIRTQVKDKYGQHDVNKLTGQYFRELMKMKADGKLENVFGRVGKDKVE